MRSHRAHPPRLSLIFSRKMASGNYSAPMQHRSPTWLASLHDAAVGSSLPWYQPPMPIHPLPPQRLLRVLSWIACSPTSAPRLGSAPMPPTNHRRLPRHSQQRLLHSHYQRAAPRPAALPGAGVHRAAAARRRATQPWTACSRPLLRARVVARARQLKAAGVICVCARRLVHSGCPSAIGVWRCAQCSS